MNLGWVGLWVSSWEDSHGEANVIMAEDERASEPKKKVDGLTEVLANIAAMSAHDQAMAMRFHSIIESGAVAEAETLVRDARIRE